MYRSPEGDACPHCGCGRVRRELRDSDLPNPSPKAVGEWTVCEACRHQWHAAEIFERERVSDVDLEHEALFSRRAAALLNSEAAHALDTEEWIALLALLDGRVQLDSGVPPRVQALVTCERLLEVRDARRPDH